MSDDPKPKTLTQKISSFFSAVATVVGVSGGILGVKSYYNRRELEVKLAHQACLTDLARYPVGIRPLAQEMTEAVFRWSLTPDFPHAKEAKRASFPVQIQLQEYKSIFKKHELSSQALDAYLGIVDQVIESIKQGAPDFDLIQSYSDSLNYVISMPRPLCK